MLSLLTALAVDWLRKMSSRVIPVLLCALLASCAVMDSVLDAPMSLFDEETGETVETTVGDAIADNADGVAGVVEGVLGGVHPGLALLGGGAAAALMGKARRKKKAVVVHEAATAEDQEAKA